MLSWVRTSAVGPAAITTFRGTAQARFTDATADDYFADGSLQHLSHIVLDLAQWYEEPYDERVQHMFRANPAPARGYADQFADGGGPAFVPNEFRGRDDARRSAIGANTEGGLRRIGHASALQRASRAADGTPLHLRVDSVELETLTGDRYRLTRPGGVAIGMATQGIDFSAARAALRPCFERTEEIRRLLATLGQGPSWVFITGPAGVGKSVLLGAVLDRAQRDGVVIAQHFYGHQAAWDAHDRVNYAAQSSFLRVDELNKKITLELTIDTSVAQVMHYFEIFLPRMLMCRRAAEFLGCAFHINVNGVELL